VEPALNSRQAGLAWENVAESFLRNRGLIPRQRNFFSRWGEIDLIMDDGDVLVFIEVKYRRNNSYGSSVEMLGQNKIQRLLKAARYFLACNPGFQQHACRFDFVAIQGEKDNPEIQWITNAFTG
jgi:putative endonuclease